MFSLTVRKQALDRKVINQICELTSVEIELHEFIKETFINSDFFLLAVTIDVLCSLVGCIIDHLVDKVWSQ